MDYNTYIDTDVMHTNAEEIKRRIIAINDIFTNVNSNMLEAQTREYWKGQTSEILFSKYEELRKNYDTIITSLNVLTDFIITVADAYVDFDQQAYKSINNADLDMNHKN